MKYFFSNKIKSINSNEIGGHIGDMVNLENALSFKKEFKVLNCNNLEFRERKFYINSSEKVIIYLTPQSKVLMKAILLLIGTNPRHEATMLNARIRKVFVQKIFQFSQSVILVT